MKARLIFLDNMYESANGTLRGLIALVMMVVLYKIANLSKRKLFIIDNKIIITLLLLSCCLGVIHPNNALSSIALGSLIGFVIFTLVFMYNSDISKSYINYLYYITGGIIIAAIANYLVYKLYWNTNYRIKSSNSYYLLWQLLNLYIFIFLYKNYN